MCIAVVFCIQLLYILSNVWCCQCFLLYVSKLIFLLTPFTPAAPRCWKESVHGILPATKGPSPPWHLVPQKFLAWPVFSPMFLMVPTWVFSSLDQTAIGFRPPSCTTELLMHPCWLSAPCSSSHRPNLGPQLKFPVFCNLSMFLSALCHPCCLFILKSFYCTNKCSLKSGNTSTPDFRAGSALRQG